MLCANCLYSRLLFIVKMLAEEWSDGFRSLFNHEFFCMIYNIQFTNVGNIFINETGQ